MLSRENMLAGFFGKQILKGLREIEFSRVLEDTNIEKFLEKILKDYRGIHYHY